MKRLCLSILTASIAALAFTASASAAFEIESFDVTYTEKNGSPATQAGSHPYEMTSKVLFSLKENDKDEPIPDGSPKDLSFSLPPGLIGDRNAVPRCTDAQF